MLFHTQPFDVMSSPLKNTTKCTTKKEIPARSVFERCWVSFLWLSLKVDELRGLIWGIWVQLTYYYNLLVLLKENRDTWIYISFFLLSALAHFFILFWGFSFFLFLKINLFVYCQWSPVESRCIVPGSWNWVHNKWSYNNKLFKVWMHLSELQETKSRLTTAHMYKTSQESNEM